jgi:hypothetical protein
LKPERWVCLHPLNVPDHFVDQTVLNATACRFAAPQLSPATHNLG